MSTDLQRARLIDVAVLGSFVDGYGSGDFSNELLKVKATLLYGDHITVETYRSAFLLGRMMNQVRTTKRRWGELLDEVDTADFRDRLNEAIEERFRESGRMVDEQLLAQVGKLSARDIADLPEVLADLVRSRRADNIDPAGFFRFVSEMAVRRWVEHKPDERSATAITAIKDLNYLVDRGLVTVDPGDPTGLLLVPTDDIGAETVRMVERLLDLLTAGDVYVHPLLTDGSRSLIRGAVDPGAPLDAVDMTRANRAELVSQLFLAIPNFAELPVDELVDVREATAPYVARFRAAISELESLLESDIASVDFDNAISELRVRSVEPELEALNESLRDNGLMPTAARGAPLTASGLLGLGISAVMGGPALASAAAVGAGVSVAVAQEFLRRRATDGERRRHRLYLLWYTQQAAKGMS